LVVEELIKLMPIALTKGTTVLLMASKALIDERAKHSNPLKAISTIFQEA
jgi:hypothetical protein